MLNDFSPVELRDKEVFNRFFAADPPQISELTFTNFFIWNHRYNPMWAQRDDCLLIIFRPQGDIPYGLPPVGRGDKSKAIDILFNELEKTGSEAKICRAGIEFVEKYVDHDRYSTTLDRDNSDYVYSTIDLIRLSGRPYHKKKNHLNSFLKNYQFVYRTLDMELVECFLDMQEDWCRIKDCAGHPGLLSEDYAIYKALTHFEDLDFKGGAIQIGSRIEAFSLGEPLNPNTAVIHIEKANPTIMGLYAAINQLFCSNAWSGVEYINREQDMGIEGLRKAKESYHPHHMVHKYTILKR